MSVTAETEGFELEQEIDGADLEVIGDLDESTAGPESLGDDAADLEAIDLSEYEPQPQGETEQPQELDDEARKLQAEVSAAAVAAVLAEAIQFTLKPVKIEGNTREEFAGKLAPVLEKHDGQLPPWLASLIANWREEIGLARFMVAAGWEIRSKYKEEKRKEIEQQQREQLTVSPAPQPGEKPRVRVRG